MNHHSERTAKRRRLTENEDREIARRYREGESTTQLATAFRCSTIGIRGALNRQGQPLRSRREAQLSLTAEQERELVARYREGESVSSLSEAFGVCAVTVRRVRRDHKEPRRLGPSSGTYIKCPPEFAAMATRQGRVIAYRLVMARKLGRPLLPTETVHHIDGDRTNNSPDNLQIRNGNHGPGITLRCSACGSDRIEAVELPAA